MNKKLFYWNSGGVKWSTICMYIVCTHKHIIYFDPIYLLLHQTQVQLKMVAYSSMLRYILLSVLLKFTVLIRTNKINITCLMRGYFHLPANSMVTELKSLVRICCFTT